MAYFYPVVTKANIPNFETVANEHRIALDAYEASPTPSGKDRRIKHMTTTQTINNGSIYTTSILCCDEDDD